MSSKSDALLLAGMIEKLAGLAQRHGERILALEKLALAHTRTLQSMDQRIRDLEGKK